MTKPMAEKMNVRETREMRPRLAMPGGALMGAPPVALPPPSSSAPARTPLAVLAKLSALEWLIILQIGCQLALLIPALVDVRAMIRALSFGSSLMCLFAIKGKGKLPPAAKAAACAIVVLLIELAHPLTNSVLAGVAQVVLYASILAPIAWVPRLRVTTVELRRFLLIIWMFHGLSCGVAALQMYFPGHFEPPLNSVTEAEGQVKLDGLKIQLASGERVYRPMGLTDVPGGAAISGMYAVLLSLGIILASGRPGLRVVAIATLALGLFVLYLSQVRSLLIMTLLSGVIAVSLAWWRGLRKEALSATYVGGGVVLLAFIWALAVGGDAVTSRLATLLEEDPGTVYYTNRGFFLHYTIAELVPQYPFGAGLGRWGMMYYYFGDKNDPQRDMIWSEIMWTAWVIDGGVPLMIAYAVALGVTCMAAFRLTRRRDELGGWAIVIFAYSMGTVALTFNHNVFASQLGIEFWMMNAALFTAAVSEDRRQLMAGAAAEAARANRRTP